MGHKDINLGKIQEGSYVFSGNYSFAEYLTQITKWPNQTYIRYTVLEWWSIYDIDADLVKKWYVQAGEFVSYVSDQEKISSLSQQFEFLGSLSLENLEWFLYPDTYHIDIDTPFIKQLIAQQLRNFEKKVRNKISWELINFTSKLQQNNISMSVPMDFYKIIILASVLEKEERANKNKPTVAGIFLKRLGIWMRLDADITLCYGLKEAYQSCTPKIIAQNIADSDNIYNTRQRKELPPQPISNPSFASIDAVVNFQSSDYVYYLHDNDGYIHYGKTIAEHNQNKQLYLK